MAKHTITINFDKFTAAIANSPRSKLGKRGIKGGLEVDLSKIPDEVKTSLLLDAVRNYLQVGLKTVDQDSATTEQCQAAMRARLAILESGALSGPGQPRKAPTRDPVVANAKLAIKKAIQERSPEKLDGKVLTKMVSELFKLHAKWTKDGRPDDVKGIAGMKMIDNALAQAKAALDAQQAMAESLGGLAERASKLSAEAKAKREVAATEGDEAVEAPAKPRVKTKSR